MQTSSALKVQQGQLDLKENLEAFAMPNLHDRVLKVVPTLLPVVCGQLQHRQGIDNLQNLIAEIEMVESSELGLVETILMCCSAGYVWPGVCHA